jgi:hypothetical protein
VLDHGRNPPRKWYPDRLVSGIIRMAASNASWTTLSDVAMHFWAERSESHQNRLSLRRRCGSLRSTHPTRVAQKTRRGGPRKGQPSASSASARGSSSESSRSMGIP